MGSDELLRELRALLLQHSVKQGDFILASGKHSSLYVDARLTTMSGAGQLLIGQLGLLAIDSVGWNPSTVGGLTLGADPISYAIAHAAARAQRRIDAFTVRKEAKAHGAGKLIEGCFRPGASVVIVEDVITSGESALRAARSVASAGGHVCGVFALVDREEGGRENITKEGLEVTALVTRTDLIPAT